MSSNSSAVCHADIFEVRDLPNDPYSDDRRPQHVIALGLHVTGEVSLQQWDADGQRLINAPFQLPYSEIKLLVRDGLWSHRGSEPAALDSALRRVLAEREERQAQRFAATTRDPRAAAG